MNDFIKNYFKNRFFLAVFICIVVFGALLRLWQLGQVPPSPDWDEAALGYNAHAIATTGKDEYNTPFPIVLRSFDDYKPALYAYLIIPVYKVFGLNTVSVRLPSVLFGILTLISSYFIIRFFISSPTFPLLVVFLLSISPWHIQFSRIAFESNVGLSLNIFAILFFLYGLRKPGLLILSASFMALALYVYQSEKVFTPLLALVLAVVFRSELFHIPKKYIASAILIGTIIALPIVNYTLTSKEALTRAKGVSIFSASNQFLDDYAKRNIINQEQNNFLGFIFDNRRVLYFKFLVGNYLSHYNFYWLFISGDEARHHAPEMGLLYFWELPFLLIGIYSLLFGKWDRRFKWLIFGWFLIAPVPAAFTTGVPHAVRTLNFLPTFQIFIAIGILSALSSISNIKYEIAKIRIKYLIFSIYFLFFIFNFLYYLNQYFVQQNQFNSEAWQYGYKETIKYIKMIDSKYQKIIVSNQPHLDQSYMFFLFYLQYPPEQYQKERANISGGFAENHQFGKYEFRPIRWDSEEKNGKILYVGRPYDFQNAGVVPKKIIYFLNGKPAIYIVQG